MHTYVHVHVCIHNYKTVTTVQQILLDDSTYIHVPTMYMYIQLHVHTYICTPTCTYPRVGTYIICTYKHTIKVSILAQCRMTTKFGELLQHRQIKISPINIQHYTILASYNS